MVTGLVTSFIRPTGNMTGVTWMGVDLLAKDLDLLHEFLPNVPVFGVLLNPGRTDIAVQLKIAQDTANKIGRKIRALPIHNSGDIDAAFATIVAEHINLKTAKAFGLTIPLPLLGHDDEVIEQHGYFVRCICHLLAQSGQTDRL